MFRYVLFRSSYFESKSLAHAFIKTKTPDTQKGYQYSKHIFVVRDLQKSKRPHKDMQNWSNENTKSAEEPKHLYYPPTYLHVKQFCSIICFLVFSSVKNTKISRKNNVKNR